VPMLQANLFNEKFTKPAVGFIKNKKQKMKHISVDEAVKKIWNYYNQTVLYSSTPRTALSKPKVIYFPKSIEVDICNEKDIDTEGLNILIPNLDFAFKALSSISKKTVEQCMADSRILLENDRVDTNKKLFPSVRIVPL